MAYFHVLTPLPGTAMFDRVRKVFVFLIGTGAKYTAACGVLAETTTTEQLQTGSMANPNSFAPSIWKDGRERSGLFSDGMNRSSEVGKRTCPQRSVSPSRGVLGISRRSCVVARSNDSERAHALKQAAIRSALGTQ